jgi:hypothetical protein
MKLWIARIMLYIFCLDNLKGAFGSLLLLGHTEGL